MTHFDHAIDIVLEHEGGFVDNVHDPGGATNYGISLRWLEKIGDLDNDGFADGDIDRDGDVDAADIQMMSPNVAKQFYKQHFWDDDYDLIFDRDVATKVFDMAVNMGAKQAHKLLQRATRSTGADIKDDGAIGPNTLHAINHAVGGELLAATRSEQAGFYRALILRNSALRSKGFDVPDFNVFRTGWLRRAYA